MAIIQKIVPFLWFDHQAEEAIQLYTTVFPDSQIQQLVRNGDAVLTASFTLHGQSFVALNGGPMFKFNPSISFYTICESETESDEVWQKLSEGGSVLMPYNKYPWSEKYGWLVDRYGVSWQITVGKIADLGQKFTPALMFTGEQHGRAEEALNYYSSIFKNSGTQLISRYPAGGRDPEGTINHAQFRLEKQMFIVMDSAMEHPFQFNEALSLVISCDTQAEIDFFWDKLTADGGVESQCGWVKDKFGVSWQIVPPVLSQLLGDANVQKSQQVMQAMLKMRKLDIALLQQAYDHE
jgi:predicted 3-demethylubiquinone-9 3-methyltransferase (glyoxalase superfamily)